MRKFLGALAIGSMALSGLSVIAASPAEAGPRNYSYGGGHYGGSYGSYRGGRHYNRGHHYRGRHRGGHGAANVLLGVGAGLLLYSAIDSANDRRHASAYGGGYYAPQRVYGVAQPPQYAERPGPIPARAAPVGEQAASDCLQTREYQTTITIGGEEKDAYGTACLQPDGDWKMGSPTLVPDYE
ncbi:hypothetical protein [Iodidimonas gelatinilytica]|nr:hypothetical protein [Iodidimonas gelatinilytica]